MVVAVEPVPAIIQFVFGGEPARTPIRLVSRMTFCPLSVTQMAGVPVAPAVKAVKALRPRLFVTVDGGKLLRKTMPFALAVVKLEFVNWFKPSTQYEVPPI